MWEISLSQELEGADKFKLEKNVSELLLIG